MENLCFGVSKHIFYYLSVFRRVLGSSRAINGTEVVLQKVRNERTYILAIGIVTIPKH